MKEARTFYQSILWNADTYDQWEAKGRKDDMTLAKEKADWILKNHKPTLLDRDISKKLDTIFKSAAKS